MCVINILISEHSVYWKVFHWFELFLQKRKFTRITKVQCSIGLITWGHPFICCINVTILLKCTELIWFFSPMIFGHCSSKKLNPPLPKNSQSVVKFNPINYLFHQFFKNKKSYKKCFECCWGQKKLCYVFEVTISMYRYVKIKFTTFLTNLLGQLV